MIQLSDWYQDNQKDNSLILSNVLYKQKLEEVKEANALLNSKSLAPFKPRTKYQRIIFKEAKGSQVDTTPNSNGDTDIKFELWFSMFVCRLVSSSRIDVDADYNHLINDSSDEELDFGEILESSCVVNLPTVSIMDSNKNLTQFKKVFEESFPHVELNIKKKKSAIWEILMNSSDTKASM